MRIALSCIAVSPVFSPLTPFAWTATVPIGIWRLEGFKKFYSIQSTTPEPNYLAKSKMAALKRKQVPSTSIPQSSVNKRPKHGVSLSSVDKKPKNGVSLSSVDKKLKNGGSPSNIDKRPKNGVSLSSVDKKLRDGGSPSSVNKRGLKKGDSLSSVSANKRPKKGGSSSNVSKGPKNGGSPSAKVPRAKRALETETDSDPIVESDTTENSGDDNGVSWPSDHESAAQDSSADEGAGVAISQKTSKKGPYVLPRKVRLAQKSGIGMISPSAHPRQLTSHSINCLQRNPRQAKSPRPRAQSRQTQRTAHRPVETAMGTITKKVSRATRRAEEACRRAV